MPSLWQVFKKNRKTGKKRQVKPTRWRRKNKSARYQVAKKKAAQKGGWIRRVPGAPAWRTHLVGDVIPPKDASIDAKRNFKRLRNKLGKAAKSRKEVWRVNSGVRSTTRQQMLYNAYLQGIGPLAAKPGTSNHELGLAADVVRRSDNKNVGDIVGAKESLRRHGLHLTIPGEPWHVTELGVYR